MSATKPEAITAALYRLAALIHATVDDPLLIATAEICEDMPPRALQLAFEHLERKSYEVPMLPSPGDIREIGMELLRKEQSAAREGRVLDELRALEKRKREHPEEFATEEDVRKLIRAAYKTTPGDARTTPKEENSADKQRATENQTKKVALHKPQNEGA